MYYNGDDIFVDSITKAAHTPPNCTGASKRPLDIGKSGSQACVMPDPSSS